MESNTVKIIFGRLGADPRLAYSKKGEAICEFPIAQKITKEVTE